MFYEKTVLDNGVTVLSEHMDGVRSVALGLWMRVGNRDERPQEYGMSHFMEHMLFKGTPLRSAADISMAFDSLGAELNAFTTREYTCFYARMIDEHLDDGFEILADMLVNASFAQDDIDLEREVVIEEIARSEDQPEDQVFDLLADALLPGHPLGRPVLGTRENVSRFSTPDMRAYHDEHYTAGNLTVVASGSVDHARLVELAEKWLVHMRQGQRKQRPVQELGPRGRLAVVTKPTEQAHVLVGLPGVSATDPRRYACALADLALGGGMSSRLFQEIREKRGLVYSVYTLTNYYEDLGTFAVYAGTRPENIAEVLQVVREEFARMARGGVSEEELARVRELASGNLVLSMESTRTHMVRLGRLATCGVPLTSIDELLEQYKAVTVEDVNAFAEELLEQQPTVAVVSPCERGQLEEMLA